MKQMQGRSETAANAEWIQLFGNAPCLCAFACTHTGREEEREIGHWTTFPCRAQQMWVVQQVGGGPNPAIASRGLTLLALPLKGRWIHADEQDACQRAVQALGCFAQATGMQRSSQIQADLEAITACPWLPDASAAQPSGHALALGQALLSLQNQCAHSDARGWLKGVLRCCTTADEVHLSADIQRFHRLYPFLLLFTCKLRVAEA